MNPLQYVNSQHQLLILYFELAWPNQTQHTPADSFFVFLFFFFKQTFHGYKTCLDATLVICVHLGIHSLISLWHHLKLLSWRSCCSLLNYLNHLEIGLYKSIRIWLLFNTLFSLHHWVPLLSYLISVFPWKMNSETNWGINLSETVPTLYNLIRLKKKYEKRLP